MAIEDISKESRSATEDRYRMLVEQSPDGIAIYDIQGRFHDVNTRACEMLGYTRDELLSLTVSEVVAPEDLERQPLRYEILKSGAPLIDERLLLCKDGSRLPVELSARMLSDGLIQVIVRDITQRKLAEEEIRRLNIQLEGRVLERTQQLEDTNRELRAEIAERQRAEEALRITQAQLQRLVESNIIGILVGDFTGHILYANDALLDMLGYSREDVKTGKMSWADLTPSEMLHLDNAALKELQETAVYKPHERVYIHKDGTRVPVLIGAARLEGSINIAVAYIVNISERKKLEERLRMREREFGTLVENAPDIIFRLDTDLRHTYINSAVQEVSGIAPEEYLGKTWKDLGLPSNIRKPLGKACKEAIKTGQETALEFSYQGRWFRTRIVPEMASDGTVESLIGIMEDITGRRRAEEDLARSEERYRSLVEATSDVVWTSVGNGDFVEPQLSWEAYTGQPWDEHKGEGWIKMVHPEDRAHLLEVWGKAVAHKMIYRGVGRLWNAATDEYRYFTVRAVPLLSSDGSVREWIGAVTDIHERRKATQEREQLLASEQEARRDAEGAVHARDELLAIVSHDLKNPLTAIKGYSQLLRRRLSLLDARNWDRLEQVIGRIDESSNKMNQLLNDLLDFGRLQAGQPLTLQRRPLNLVDLARTAAVEFRRTTTDHRIVVEAETEPVIGRWDATRLEQVVANLLSNAIKYSPDGGVVTLRVWREAGSKAGYEDGGDANIPHSHGDWAMLAIEDQGIGIADTELPHIFEWYRRAKNVSGRISGAGIGLASAKYIITQHGGDITVTSQRGVGSTFIIRLPL